MIRIKQQSFVQLLFFFVGLFSTMSVVFIPIMGRVVSVFSICLMLSFVVLIVKEYTISFSASTKGVHGYFIFWVIASILSSAFGLVFFIGYPDWQSEIITYLIKFLIYVLFFFLLNNISLDAGLEQLIIKGIFWGILINVIWAITDAVIYYSLGFSITNSLFSSYITLKNIRYGTLALISNGTIRSGGLNADPANIGFFATALAAYGFEKRKIGLVIIAIAGAAASVSLIAVVGIVCVFFVYCIKNKRKIDTFLVVIALLVFIFILFYSDNSVICKLRESIIERILLKKDIAGTSKRSTYFIEFFRAVLLQPISLLIGTGFGTSSYSYLINGLVNVSFSAYDPECTYIAYFFDCGLPGFIMFLLMNIKIVQWAMKGKETIEGNNYMLMLYSVVISMIFVLAGYHYIIYSPMMLITICSVSLMNKEEKNA